jgi:hypothetical protein
MWNRGRGATTATCTFAAPRLLASLRRGCPELARRPLTRPGPHGDRRSPWARRQDNRSGSVSSRVGSLAVRPAPGRRSSCTTPGLDCGTSFSSTTAAAGCGSGIVRLEAGEVLIDCGARYRVVRSSSDDARDDRRDQDHEQEEKRQGDRDPELLLSGHGLSESELDQHILGSHALEDHQYTCLLAHPVLVVAVIGSREALRRCVSRRRRTRAAPAMRGWSSQSHDRGVSRVARVSRCRTGAGSTAEMRLFARGCDSCRAHFR